MEESKMGNQIRKNKGPGQGRRGRSKKGAKQQASAPIAKKKVDFFLRYPDAKEVYLVGDFNSWTIGKHPMYKTAGGKWRKTVTLAKGTYEYRFVVDGNWYTDPDREKKTNPFGDENNIITVN